MCVGALVEFKVFLSLRPQEINVEEVCDAVCGKIQFMDLQMGLKMRGFV